MTNNNQSLSIKETQAIYTGPASTKGLALDWYTSEFAFAYREGVLNRNLYVYGEFPAGKGTFCKLLAQEISALHSKPLQIHYFDASSDTDFNGTLLRIKLSMKTRRNEINTIWVVENCHLLDLGEQWELSLFMNSNSAEALVLATGDARLDLMMPEMLFFLICVSFEPPTFDGWVHCAQYNFAKYGLTSDYAEIHADFEKMSESSWTITPTQFVEYMQSCISQKTASLGQI